MSSPCVVLARPRRGAARIASLIALLASAALGQEAALPEPPTGFRWERAPDIKGAFLAPQKWFFRSEKQKNTYAYFVSRENIAGGGEFLVGLTVTVMPPLADKDAVSYAREFMAAYPADKKQSQCSDSRIGALVGGGCLVE